MNTAKLNEIVTGLVEHARIGGDCFGCPYRNETFCHNKLCEDALKLLQAQEPRILTKDEIIGWHGYIWKEYKNIRTMTVSFIQHGIENVPYQGDFLADLFSWYTYKKKWRCWDKEPTDEQREAVKWDG